MEAGIIRWVKIWILLAPKVFNNFTLSSSTSWNPAKTLMIVTTMDINKAIITMAFIPLPTQNIIIGAKATLGKAFNTTK